MSKIYFGYITSTHGLKGELKCFSTFERTDLVFKPNFPIYINDHQHLITSSRPHKTFTLITIDNLKDINLVEQFRHQKIYIERHDLPLKENEFLFMDLIGFTVSEDGKKLGKVTEIRYNNGGILLNVASSSSFLIPYQDFYIKKIDWLKGQIEVKNAKGLML